MKKISISKSRRETIAKIGKVITAVILGVIMLVTVGMVQVKDSRKSASYCASCHDDYYDSWVSDGESYSLAHQHAEMSVSCQTCHDRTMEVSVTEIVNYVTGNYYYPFSETTVSDDLCLSCHGSLDRVNTLTDVSITGADRNFHMGHLTDLTCSSCHNMHRNSVLVCAECHDVDLDPGWVEPD